MRRIGRGLGALYLSVLAGLLVRNAAAQWTADLWVDLVQMPVAVARLELAGVAASDLRLLVPSLNTRGISPAIFIESVRGIRLLDGWDAGRENRDTPGMGSYVRRLHDVGLRGPQLAGAIQRELRTRGVPAGPRSARGSDVFARGFLPSQIEGATPDRIPRPANASGLVGRAGSGPKTGGRGP
jgi:hypothetical protein